MPAVKAIINLCSDSKITTEAPVSIESKALIIREPLFQGLQVAEDCLISRGQLK